MVRKVKIFRVHCVGRSGEGCFRFPGPHNRAHRAVNRDAGVLAQMLPSGERDSQPRSPGFGSHRPTNPLSCSILQPVHGPKGSRHRVVSKSGTNNMTWSSPGPLFFSLINRIPARYVIARFVIPAGFTQVRLVEPPPSHWNTCVQNYDTCFLWNVVPAKKILARSTERWGVSLMQNHIQLDQDTSRKIKTPQEKFIEDVAREESRLE